MDKFIPWYPSIDEKDFREIIWNKREFFELKYVFDYSKTLFSDSEEPLHSPDPENTEKSPDPENTEKSPDTENTEKSPDTENTEKSPDTENTEKSPDTENTEKSPDTENTEKNAKSFLYPHQIFIERFISPITPYKDLILFHNTGSGKTFSSIAVCESHKHIMSKALIIVKGNTSYMNFKEQIVKWYKAMGYDLNEIRKYYEIRKYISFSNVIKRMTDQQLKNKFSNRIIVIDEVHNLRSLDFQEQNIYTISNIETQGRDDISERSTMDNKQSNSVFLETNEEKIIESTNQNHLVYNQMWRLLHTINNYKVLLLTATPMIDKAEEIYSIINLLLEKNNQLSGPLSLEKLEKAIQGRISYLKSNEEMAKVEEEGELIPGCNIKVIPSIMTGIQLYAYRKIDTKNVTDHVYRNSVYCSLMTLADGSYGAKAFETNITKKKDIHGKPVFVFCDIQKKFITRENIHLFSCKYAKMIEIIESSKDELAFVFCEEVRGSGVIMIGCVLEALGYVPYNGEEISQLDKRPRYTIYTGDPSVCPNPEERLHGFRSKINKYGDYIKILIGSRVSGEGISLVNIRQVHIITPHWNISTVIQAIGRAVRRDSHHMLKESERKIKIYRHVAIARESLDLEHLEQLAMDEDVDKDVPGFIHNYVDNNIDKYLYTPKISIDMYKYKISEKKESLIRKVEQKMRDNAVDYYLNVKNTSIIVSKSLNSEHKSLNSEHKSLNSEHKSLNSEHTHETRVCYRAVSEGTRVISDGFEEEQKDKDISSYLIKYDNFDYNKSLNKYPTLRYIENIFKKTQSIEIKNIDIELGLLSVIIEKKIPVAKTPLIISGDKICVEPEKPVHKETTLEEYWKSILEKESLSRNNTVNSVEKKAINCFSKCSQKELINIVMSLNLDSKVRLVELSIMERVLPLMSFFYNSIIKTNGKWYHIMLYRAYEDKFSYSVSSENFNISGKTKRLDFDSINNNKKWVFVNTIEEEEYVIKSIKNKYKKYKMSIESLGLYGVVSTSDSKFRIRNIAFEDDIRIRNIEDDNEIQKEKEFVKDMRKINRGRYIDSYSLADMRLIAMYLFSNQISYIYIINHIKSNLPNIEEVITFLENMVLDKHVKKIENNNSNKLKEKELLRNKILNIIESGKYDFNLFYWIMKKKKRELKNIIINTLIDNNMYIIL